jgi:hypothetical protein
MKKDFQPEQKPNNEPLPIDSTSSPNCTKPNVVRSPNLECVSKSFIRKIQDLQLPLSQKSLLSSLHPSEFLIDVSPLSQDTKIC